MQIRDSKVENKVSHEEGRLYNSGTVRHWECLQVPTDESSSELQKWPTGVFNARTGEKMRT